MGTGRSRKEKKRRQWTTQSGSSLGAPKQWIFSLELTGAVFFIVWRGLSHCGRKEPSAMYHHTLPSLNMAMKVQTLNISYVHVSKL